jgi:RimJ/RimL family protein N-acetyltransferase
MSALPFPEPPLTDGTVLLRAWHEADEAQRHAGFADPLCQQFSWSPATPFTEEHTRAAFAQDEEGRLAGESLNLAVTDAAHTGVIWGGTSIYDVDPRSASASVGYWLAPQARGRGIATRTLRLLSAWALGQLAVERLTLTCAPDNAASQRVALRCGFVREGVLRSHLPFQGARRDTMIFSLLPGELR